MSHDFPDFHHMMSKKLAHLTAAFVYVNTKNDENEYILQAYIRQYELEMDNILNAANDIINKYMNENPDLQQLNDINTAFHAFKSKTEQERTASLTEFNAFKAALEKREKDVQSDAEKKVKELQQEVLALQERIEQLQIILERVAGNQVDPEEQKAR